MLLIPNVDVSESNYQVREDFVLFCNFIALTLG